jgi:hypothetical protein
MLHARRRPCGECPWLRAAPLGHFPVDAFQRLANTAEDMSRRVFQCHETSDGRPLVCAGFLERGADHNLTVRLAMSSGDIEPRDRSGGEDLYASYREMAVANGLDPDDAHLASCRDPRS